MRIQTVSVADTYELVAPHQRSAAVNAYMRFIDSPQFAPPGYSSLRSFYHQSIVSKQSYLDEKDFKELTADEQMFLDWCHQHDWIQWEDINNQIDNNRRDLCYDSFRGQYDEYE